MPDKHLKDKICIVGLGWTPYGEHFDKSYDDLVSMAGREAMADAGVSRKDIDAAWLGTAFPDSRVKLRGLHHNRLLSVLHWVSSTQPQIPGCAIWMKSWLSTVVSPLMSAIAQGVCLVRLTM